MYDPNDIVLCGDYAEVVLYDKYGKEVNRAKIDTEDIDKIKEHKWFYNRSGYAETKIKNKILRMQHKVFGKPSAGFDTDHINQDKLDNRKLNLRFCTRSQNMANRGKASTNTSGFKGVAWNKFNNKWKAQITINYKSMHLGYYKNKIKAAIAYNEAALKYFGEFASLNRV